MDPNTFSEFETKMRAAGLSDACIAAFRHNYAALVAGQTGQIPESSIQPVTTLPRFADIDRSTASDASLLAHTVVLKLNGGLGTSMGLESPKSLLPVKDGLTFLDLIAKQILHLRATHGADSVVGQASCLSSGTHKSDAASDRQDACPTTKPTGVRFLLMNSFSTSEPTLAALAKHPALGEPKSVELMQNFVPKIDQATLRPASWPANPQLEWCPPGHGDLFPSLLGSGWLEQLLASGVKYLFVSNADNLGASLDLHLLGYFAKSNQPFLMEVCERTAADRKGGHLAQRNGQLLLRESAQCPSTDEAAFQDITRHRFFNTNNLWVRLDMLADVLKRHGGLVPLPMIKNLKTVDPRDANSPKVVQLETAMGAAIECFANAGAIVVPRSRFAPVKTCADLLAIRSDAYEITPDWRIELRAERNGQPPALDLDSKHYKLVDQLDALTADGAPSLLNCESLTVQGAVQFSAKNIFRGRVAVSNAATVPKPLHAGEYSDCSVNV
jgi:UDP-N-acetylglucosamine pyrophosphorylase